MRVVCISDTHSLHLQMRHPIPNGDILIHAGDLSTLGYLQEVVDFNEWIRKLPHRHKIVIAGNHDLCFEQDRGLSEAYLWDCTYLQDSSIEVEGLLVYGSPWQPRFLDWAFNLDRGAALGEKWDQIPDRTDILVTHGPPFGILDQAPLQSRFGCQELLARVRSIKPRLHVFGHIHEGYGTEVVGRTQFVNAAICNSRYQPCNKPVVVDL